MRRAFITLPILAAVFVAGCAPQTPLPQRTALEHADSMELFALDPRFVKLLPPEDAAAPKFHGWKILGRVTIDAADTRRQVAEVVVDGWRWGGGEPNHCFEPRHGVRVVHDGRTVDFLLCYACRLAYVYAGDEREASFTIGGTAGERLDRLLDAAKP